MDYKLIVTDMDGTLLGSDHKITEDNKKALKEVLKNGINVTVATGRMYKSAKIHIDFLNSKIPIIACNGALIKDPVTEETIYSNAISTDVFFKILKILDKYDVYYQCSTEDLLMCKKMNKINDKRKKINDMMSKEINLIEINNFVEHTLDNEILKIVVIEEENPSILEEIMQEVCLIGGIEVTKSWFNNIEIMAVGSDKGSALKFIADYLNIKREEIIAFGDNYNDITMLEYAGTGVAMGNADDFVKSKANYVSLKNYEDGVAKAIYELIKLKVTNE